MNRYSPSSLKVFSSLCPKALTFYWERRPRLDEDPTPVGNAFHYLIEAWQVGLDLKAACITLMAKGKRGDQVPIAPEAVIEAHDLLLAIIALAEIPGGEFEFLNHKTDIVESVMSLTTAWGLTTVGSPDERFRMIYDRVHVEYGEEGYSKIVATDWKTSYQAGYDDLDSLQMKAQMVGLRILAKTLHLDPWEYETRIVNVRSRRIFCKTLPATDEELAVYRAQIEVAMDAADMAEGRARVGPACMGCPYVLRCEDALVEIEKALPSGTESPVSLAARLGIVTGAKEVLQKVLKTWVDAKGPIRIGNAVLGIHAKDKDEPQDNAGQRLLGAWLGTGGDADGFLQIIGGVSTAQVRKAAKKLKVEAEDYLTTKPGTTFGWKDSEE